MGYLLQLWAGICWEKRQNLQKQSTRHFRCNTKFSSIIIQTRSNIIDSQNMTYENKQRVLGQEFSYANSPSKPKCCNHGIMHCRINFPIFQELIRIIYKGVFVGLWIIQDWPARNLSWWPYWEITIDQPRVSNNNSLFGDMVPIVFICLCYHIRHSWIGLNHH